MASSRKRVRVIEDGMQALERSEKIKDLQRTLKIKAAFQKMKPVSAPMPSTSTATNDELLENGFTRYDIVELNPDGSEGEILNESVIVQNEMPSTITEPEVKIKEEQEELEIKDYDFDEEEINSFLSTDLFKMEPQFEMHELLDEEEDDDDDDDDKPLTLADILPPGTTYEPLKLIQRPPQTTKNPRYAYSSDDDEFKGTKSHGGRLECDICGKRFSYYRSFRQHRIDHNFSKADVQCKVCFKMIKPAALDYHMNYKHTQERKFQCRVCMRRFKSPGAMKHHENSQHREDDKYEFECKDCSRYFDCMEHLEQHMKIVHLPQIAMKIEKTQCQYCKKCFPNASQLRLHIGILGKLGKCRTTAKR